MKTLFYTLLYFLVLMLLSSGAMAQKDHFDFMLETGAVWQVKNDVQINPNSGTRYNIDNLDSGPFFHYRAEGIFRFKKNHAIRGVYAPSDIEVTGRANGPVVFNGQTFNSNQDLTVRYQFNSYRLSYIYALWGFNDDQFNLGITAKVRDAEITFTQGGTSSSYDNVGFVPLIYLEYQKALSQNFLFNFNVDAAAASQGRAIDAAIKFRYRLDNDWQIGAGARSLEGGADNDKVYTFSWFNYAVVDLVARF